MKRHLQYIFAFLFIVLVAACDTARFPIDPTPNVKVDTRLLGTWRAKGKHEEFTLIKQTDYTYLILYRNRKHDDMEKYPAFLSMVDSASFLNISSQDDSTSGYFFMRILNVNYIKNVVTAVSLSDSTLKDITEPAGVRERITQNLNNPAFYSDTTYFFRIR